MLAIKWRWDCFTLLFSPFTMKRLVAQESVVLSECCILHNMMFWSQMSYHRVFPKKMAYFNVKCYFAYTMKHCLLEKYAHNITQYHDEKRIHGDVVTISHTAKVRTRCTMMMFVDVANWHLVRFIHNRLHVHHNYNWKLQKMFGFDSNWAHSWAWGSLTIGVGWSFTSFPSIGSSLKFKPIWIPLFHATSTNSAHFLLCIDNFLSCQLHIFFNRHFFTSKTQRDLPIHLFLLSLSISHIHHTIHSKIDTPICK